MTTARNRAEAALFLVTAGGYELRLLVAVATLRLLYSGPTTIYTTRPESDTLGERLADEPRLGLRASQYPEIAAGRNSAYLTKLSLLSCVPYDAAAVLDADTLIVGDISALFELSDEAPFVATQFANWRTNQPPVLNRLERWRTLEQRHFPLEYINSLVDTAQADRPAVNGGVFAFRAGAPILRPWYELAAVGWETFIPDEIALQLLLPHYPHRLLDCRYNCSPVHAADTEDVRIWHFHGSRHLETRFARSLWLPAFRECWDQNLAGVQAWAAEVSDPAEWAVIERYLATGSLD
ncbi:MAG: hypothetical protein U0836_11465 [Pirellulales bacterium]